MMRVQSHLVLGTKKETLLSTFFISLSCVLASAQQRVWSAPSDQVSAVWKIFYRCLRYRVVQLIIVLSPPRASHAKYFQNSLKYFSPSGLYLYLTYFLGCKIKALRAKTNTYIKTPVRGEEPVFVVTGRKEDVVCAKREILSAAEHFSQIRATRKNNINSTLALGQMMANTPGQTSIQVRVPYRVVGLVVGPKGATIKRIQQQTHTYIVTPSRDKEPVFEVTGLPENVEMAKKEIEAHIELRTGGAMEGEPDYAAFNNGSPTFSGLMNDNNKGMLGDYNNTNSILTRLNSGGSVGSNCSNSNGLSGGINNFLSNNDMNLHSLLSEGSSSNNQFCDNNADNNKFDSNFDLLLSRNNDGRSIGRSLWGCGDSHDSGIGHSPPYDSAADHWPAPTNNGAIWNELGKMLGNMDSPTERHSPLMQSSLAISKPSPRSASIDLGIAPDSVLTSADSLTTDSSINQTNSLPFTLETLSASLSTLSVGKTDSRQESLLASLTGGHHSPDQSVPWN